MVTPLQRTTEADDDQLHRTRLVVDRLRRLRTERSLTPSDLAHLLQIDLRTIKGWEQAGFKQTKEPSPALVRELEAGRLVANGRSNRALFVGPGVELIRSWEEALGVPPGTATRGIYWSDDGGTLEERVESDASLDPGTKQAVLTLLRAARDRAQVDQVSPHKPATSFPGAAGSSVKPR